MSRAAAEVRQVSQCVINPQQKIQDSHNIEKIRYLTPWELAYLSIDYIQGGLLFPKPQTTTDTTVIDHLKHSLSLTLTNFPTLAGRLVTKKGFNPPSYSVCLDCTNSQGALFIHAVTDLTVADFLSVQRDIPQVVKSFFPCNGNVNHDGHTKPLVAVQVTELVDGIFIASSLNHSIVDGTSSWHFLSTWAEITREKKTPCMSISSPPINTPWFLDGQRTRIINLPFSHHNEFIKRYTPPLLRERVFHLSANAVAGLKLKANMEANTKKISLLQAVSAFVWRCITRARNLEFAQKTCCIIPINNRSRLRPVLSENYFGTCIGEVTGSATSSEILGNNLGWLAWMLHVAIASHTDKKIRMGVQEWVKKPHFYHNEELCGVPTMQIQSSPRFNVYGADFGWGKPLGFRSGPGNKFDGNVYPMSGREEEGSMDLEICLSHKSMGALIMDDEFMSAVSPSLFVCNILSNI